MKLSEYPDEDLMIMGLANKLAGQLENVLVHEDRASFVVPGGTTPGPVFDALCAATIQWDRVDIMLSDERWLPEAHVRSNARLIRERLLQGPAAQAVFHPYYTGHATPEETLAEVESAIAPCLPISVLLLGMGTDMHTASLFPKSRGLAEALSPQTRTILQTIEAEGQPEMRVSMTAHVLNGALNKHLVITGAEKRKALERATTLSPERAPVNAVLEDMEVHWAA